MAYISEIKSKDDPTSAADYIEVTVAPGESASDFDIVIYRRSGALMSTTSVDTGTFVELGDGTRIYTLSIQTWEGGTVNGPAGVALVSDPGVVEQFVAVGTADVTAVGGPAAGMTATGVGNSAPGESHYWNSTGTYTGIDPSTPGTICFANGTYIETKNGPRLVQDLVEGDLVLTRDNGYEPLRWIGAARRTKYETAKHENLQPVIIRQDAFGLGYPSRDLVVSQQHRILSTRMKNSLYFGEAESLIAAKHMIDNTSILSGGVCDITYYHLLFDAHEIIRSNDTWTESFLPNEYALSTVSEASRREVEVLFPEMAKGFTNSNYLAARYVLNKKEAKVLLM
jgi:hypothetical protein